MKPLLFLDVDGVLNEFDAPLPLRLGLYTEHLVAKSRSYWRQLQVTLDHAHPQMLHQLQESFHLVWATAWERNANGRLRTLLRIEELPVVCFSQIPVEQIGTGLHWKTERLLAYAAGRPFCWIDDEPTRADQQYLDDAGARALIIGTEPVHGLQKHHVQAALDFAAAVNHDQGEQEWQAA